MHTEGGVQVQFRDIKANAGLVPLPIRLDKGDQADGGVEEAGGQVRDAVEGLRRGGVENIVSGEGAEPFWVCRAARRRVVR
jgi:hypothetical protein